ncbi:uncharacterized protein LOC114298043 [Camellia sinensis]|uniref:uncharacterized protein LOC114298043 n=1 Tax=Camellia sinensis TaxID=4442 RepID=UPI0010358CE7|nr:uncharacterized protein LOC114298043 [Camellia sinensis]
MGDLANLFTEQKELIDELDKMRVEFKIPGQETVLAAVMAQPTLLEDIKSHQMEDDVIKKGYLADPSHVIDYHHIELDDKLTYEEKPIRILDRQVKQLRNREIPMVKVEWQEHYGTGATWEKEEEMQHQYPHLFLP